MEVKSLNIAKNLSELCEELRKLEIQEKKLGYKSLEYFKESLPEPVYLALISCLDNPEKEFIVNINYK